MQEGSSLMASWVFFSGQAVWWTNSPIIGSSSKPLYLRREAVLLCRTISGGSIQIPEGNAGSVHIAASKKYSSRKDIDEKCNKIVQPPAYCCETALGTSPSSPCLIWAVCRSCGDLSASDCCLQMPAQAGQHAWRFLQFHYVQVSFVWFPLQRFE